MALPIRNEAIIKAEKKELYVPKNEADVQRLKIQKLMNNPDKPVFIPDRPKAKKLKAAPEFVRDVMGSSAGAGSGEFHVYRHIRRREYNRQAHMDDNEKRCRLDEEYHNKLLENKKTAEETTAKKRAKRLRKKKAAAAAKQKKRLDTSADKAENRCVHTIAEGSGDENLECINGPNIVIPNHKHKQVINDCNTDT